MIPGFEDDIRIVDEDDGGSVFLGSLKHLFDFIEKTAACCVHRSVDQKEFSLKPVRQCSADRRFACSWRAGQQNAALRLEIELKSAGLVFKRQRYFCLQLFDDLLHSLQIAPGYRLDFFQIDIA